MAHEEGAPDAIEDLKYLVLIVIGLGVIWYASGGYDRFKASRAGTTATSTEATSTIYIVQ
ncbi:MAG: hypothetical protein PHS53_01735 [Candidatus Pacebacteria bacterium]|nr:hypothetical protein [Candidatus Paceibacterota bacterium]MDD5356850.1 hypothetical protein [Candidatus Paceibacterota bacterium]